MATKIRFKRKNDIIPIPKPDRRLLWAVPDPDEIRTNKDRRSKSMSNQSVRYKANYSVRVVCFMGNGQTQTLETVCADISPTGIMLKISNRKEVGILLSAKKIKLKFVIPSGTMPEGYEMHFYGRARLIWTKPCGNGEQHCGLEFNHDLEHHSKLSRYINMTLLLFLSLFFMITFLTIIRLESVLYFEYNKFIYMYGAALAIFLFSRYLFAWSYRPSPIDPDFTPSVSIILSSNNNVSYIERSIISCLNQDYPIQNLEVIIANHGSNVATQEIKDILDNLFKESDRFKVKDRLKLICHETKHDVLALAIKESKHQLIAFTDTNSFINPYAIKHLVQPFADNKMGGVCARTQVANIYTNLLTKIQTVRYHLSFRIMKAAESYFDAVIFLKGLTCYRKELLNCPISNIGRNYRTSYQDSAICETIVPNDFKSFAQSQYLEKYDIISRSFKSMSFIWKKEPFMSIMFYIGIAILLLFPIIVILGLIVIPITNNVFPFAFILGIIMTLVMMGATQFLLQRTISSVYSMWCGIFCEFIFIWQIPVAIISLIKSKGEK